MNPRDDPEWIRIHDADDIARMEPDAWVGCEFPERPYDDKARYSIDCRSCVIAFKAAITNGIEALWNLPAIIVDKYQDYGLGPFCTSEEAAKFLQMHLDDMTIEAMIKESV